MDIAETELADLKQRLRNTRWAAEWPTAPWEAGTDAAELRRLVEYWADGYDWRANEAAINALPWHAADIAGIGVSYLRYDGEHPNSLPIVLTNGWPSSVLELADFAERLANPTRFGGSADDAFTVIVPSLPGFGFSGQREPLPSTVPTHELWHRLMRDELGFERYAAHGGDLGAGITSRLGQAHPESVVGVHVMAVGMPSDFDPASATDGEREYLAQLDEWVRSEGAYGHQQSTKPLTLAPALSDSPAGLLSWLLEKYRSWSDSYGDLSSRFSDDFLLTQASLYWFTNAISTSFRPYYENGKVVGPISYVIVPTAVALFPADLNQPPRSWAERTHNVVRYTTMPRGGHFAAYEEPELLAADIVGFLRMLRSDAVGDR
jgi:pimeloyl-ACP methyl ester carboxylesterase